MDLVLPDDLKEELNQIPFIDFLGQITLQTIDIQSPCIFSDITEGNFDIHDHLKSVYGEV